jgi:hypothetical protein
MGEVREEEEEEEGGGLMEVQPNDELFDFCSTLVKVYSAYSSAYLSRAPRLLFPFSFFFFLLWPSLVE